MRRCRQHLRELEFRRGVLESAELAKGNKGRGYMIHKPPAQRWLSGCRSRTADELQLHDPCPRRERLQGAGGDPREGINLVANAVAQSADHIKSFFTMLRLELAFYLGCLNLHERLAREGRADLLSHAARRWSAHAHRRRRLRRLPHASPRVTESSATT